MAIVRVTLTDEQKEQLRRQAFEQRTSMSALVRESLVVATLKQVIPKEVPDSRPCCDGCDYRGHDWKQFHDRHNNDCRRFWLCS